MYRELRAPDLARRLSSSQPNCGSNRGSWAHETVFSASPQSPGSAKPTRSGDLVSWPVRWPVGFHWQSWPSGRSPSCWSPAAGRAGSQIVPEEGCTTQ